MQYYPCTPQDIFRLAQARKMQGRAGQPRAIACCGYPIGTRPISQFHRGGDRLRSTGLSVRLLAWPTTHNGHMGLGLDAQRDEQLPQQSSTRPVSGHSKTPFTQTHFKNCSPEKSKTQHTHQKSFHNDRNTLTRQRNSTNDENPGRGVHGLWNVLRLGRSLQLQGISISFFFFLFPSRNT